ncbi:phosphotransferase [Colletotrichum scovillei]|uniref:Phosphotransferase n=1 Tax=Colletotrichum scovillei TaxID=1209932 RepID=A0A9P7QXH1_9PEZI|nr:phosphotransferase [Colletotrichum scovillei]KAF4781255.1 phosphotransferase [Colletotrichum scovillei]KAG7045185.1 phosphotransferase [Colletotrichum scovillei]KAG7052348.1 phosphotransferase [Colletotrichum scovillei]KAG7064639.1 phosphotransferase [Colletotrichum scovillei]
MAARQDSDNLKWDQTDKLWDEDVEQISLRSHSRKVEALAETVMGSPGKVIEPVILGGYHVLYTFRLDGEASPANVLIRLSCLSQGILHEEMMLSEAATARYLTQFTQLIVPKVYQHGVDPVSGLGPFLIIQDMGSRKTLGHALSPPDSDTLLLDPDIPEARLKDLYYKIAQCVLQLTRPTFSRIGALVETTPGSICVAGRPVTLNMTNMVKLSNIPKSVLPAKDATYQTADEWYVELAEMQMATLLFQHNDMISSEDDCRTKYVARQLFRRLAKQGRLSSFGFAQDDWSALAKHKRATMPMPDNSGSFHLWCDDFRPDNILADDNNGNVLGTIDWEFSYVAPTQFSLDSPWWLLLDVPESRKKGVDDWATEYERRLPTWLSALEDAEKEVGNSGLPFTLSAYMRDSWATGRFWLNYAARKSWAFDAIYWKYLDEKFFGQRDPNSKIPKSKLWKTRIHLLSSEEQAAMDTMVQIKIEESKERKLVEWEDAEARQRLSSFLFD